MANGTETVSWKVVAITACLLLVTAFGMFTSAVTWMYNTHVQAFVDHQREDKEHRQEDLDFQDKMLQVSNTLYSVTFAQNAMLKTLEKYGVDVKKLEEGFSAQERQLNRIQWEVDNVKRAINLTKKNAATVEAAP